MTLRNEQVVAVSNSVVPRSDSRIVTGMMLGAFLAFGVDTIIIVGVLWYVGRISGETAAVVSAAVLIVFALWIFIRWVRFRWTGRLDSESAESTESRDQRDPLEQLKQRYAEGEISDSEFEKQLDTLLDADRQAESSENRSTLVPNDRGRE
ncbi:SHOCT domain-containing protein [Natronomonas gomsonensis]|uniref:SHOCT domain-containing protein n=2 Tax=Natronomonas gomsonensis TaxID=1046043 RepID=UPI00349F9E3D|nr:SHOCT domain-containing protein [Natronomonas gomsonensis]